MTRITSTLWLLAPLLLSAQTAVVEGQAVSGITGEPVAGLRVGPYDTPKLFTITDAAGHFRLPGVATGSQSVTASGVGWLDRPAAIHPGSGQKGAAIQLRMLPEAVISGKVDDEDGSPVSESRVMMVRYSVSNNDWQQVASVFTNDRGEYRFGKLLPGRYWLQVQPGSHLSQWDPRYITAYHPGPPAEPDSPALSLAIGQQVSSLNFRLRREEGRQVRGRVIWPAGIATPPKTLRMQSGEPGGPFVVNRTVNLAPNGTFAERHVSPGSYRLSLELRDNPNLSPAQAAYRQIQVADADIDGVVLEVKPLTGQDVAGTLATDAGMKPDGFQVVLNCLGSKVFPAQPDSHGDFVAHGVPPGTCQVRLKEPDGRYALLPQVRFGDAPAIRRDMIQLDDQPTSLLHITVPPPRISLHGSVKGADNRPLTDGLVALWGGTAERYGRGSTLADGGFTVEVPLPGEYHVYIVNDVLLSRLLDGPGYLKEHARDYPPVTVVEGQNPPLELVYSGK